MLTASRADATAMARLRLAATDDTARPCGSTSVSCHRMATPTNIHANGVDPSIGNSSSSRACSRSRWTSPACWSVSMLCGASNAAASSIAHLLSSSLGRRVLALPAQCLSSLLVNDVYKIHMQNMYSQFMTGVHAEFALNIRRCTPCNLTGCAVLAKMRQQQPGTFSELSRRVCSELQQLQPIDDRVAAVLQEFDSFTPPQALLDRLAAAGGSVAPVSWAELEDGPTLVGSGPIEAASNTETSCMQAVQEAVVVASAASLEAAAGLQLDRTERLAASLGRMAAVVESINGLSHTADIMLMAVLRRTFLGGVILLPARRAAGAAAELCCWDCFARKQPPSAACQHRPNARTTKSICQSRSCTGIRAQIATPLFGTRRRALPLLLVDLRLFRPRPPFAAHPQPTQMPCTMPRSPRTVQLALLAAAVLMLCSAGPASSAAVQARELKGFAAQQSSLVLGHRMLHGLFKGKWQAPPTKAPAAAAPIIIINNPAPVPAPVLQQPVLVQQQPQMAAVAVPAPQPQVAAVAVPAPQVAPVAVPTPQVAAVAVPAPQLAAVAVPQVAAVAVPAMAAAPAVAAAPVIVNTNVQQTNVQTGSSGGKKHPFGLLGR